MYSSKEELVKRAEKHERFASDLRQQAAGKFINDAGDTLAMIDENGVLTFQGRAPKLLESEFDRFATWLRRCKRM